MTAKKGLLPWLGAFVALDMVILGALLAPFWQDLRMDPQNVTGILVRSPPIFWTSCSPLMP